MLNRTISNRLIYVTLTTLILIIAMLTSYYLLMRPAPVVVIKQNSYINTVDTNNLMLTKESQLLFGIKTASVHKEQLISGIKVNGTIKIPPQASADVLPLIGGRARMLHSYTLGSIVKKGEQLVVIDQQLSAAETAGLMASQVELNSKTAELQAQIKTAETTLHAAQLELDRANNLYKADAAPLKRVQDAETAVQIATTELASVRQRANISAIGAKQIMPARALTLTSPINGIIAEINFTADEQVEANKRLFRIVSLDNVLIEAQVFEKDLNAIANAKYAVCTVPAFPDLKIEIGKQHNNHLLTIAPTVDANKRTIAVVYQINNPENRLRDGMAVEIAINNESASKEALTVPKSAITEENGQKYLYVYLGGETFMRRNVVTGLVDGDRVEIISGITEGERIVVDGIYQLRANKKA